MKEANTKGIRLYVRYLSKVIGLLSQEVWEWDRGIAEKKEEDKPIADEIQLYVLVVDTDDVIGPFASKKDAERFSQRHRMRGEVTKVCLPDHSLAVDE